MTAARRSASRGSTVALPALDSLSQPTAATADAVSGTTIWARRVPSAAATARSRAAGTRSTLASNAGLPGEEARGPPLAPLVAGVQLAQRIGARADLPRRFPCALERRPAGRLLA